MALTLEELYAQDKPKVEPKKKVTLEDLYSNAQKEEPKKKEINKDGTGSSRFYPDTEEFNPFTSAMGEVGRNFAQKSAQSATFGLWNPNIADAQDQYSGSDNPFVQGLVNFGAGIPGEIPSFLIGGAVGKAITKTSSPILKFGSRFIPEFIKEGGGALLTKTGEKVFQATRQPGIKGIIAKGVQAATGPGGQAAGEMFGGYEAVKKSGEAIKEGKPLTEVALEGAKGFVEGQITGRAFEAITPAANIALTKAEVGTLNMVKKGVESSPLPKTFKEGAVAKIEGMIDKRLAPTMTLGERFGQIKEGPVTKEDLVQLQNEGYAVGNTPQDAAKALRYDAKLKSKGSRGLLPGEAYSATSGEAKAVADVAEENFKTLQSRIQFENPKEGKPFTLSQRANMAMLDDAASLNYASGKEFPNGKTIYSKDPYVQVSLQKGAGQKFELEYNQELQPSYSKIKDLKHYATWEWASKALYDFKTKGVNTTGFSIPELEGIVKTQVRPGYVEAIKAGSDYSRKGLVENLIDFYSEEELQKVLSKNEIYSPQKKAYKPGATSADSEAGKPLERLKGVGDRTGEEAQKYLEAPILNPLNERLKQRAFFESLNSRNKIINMFYDSMKGNPDAGKFFKIARRKVTEIPVEVGEIADQLVELGLNPKVLDGLEGTVSIFQPKPLNAGSKMIAPMWKNGKRIDLEFMPGTEDLFNVLMGVPSKNDQNNLLLGAMRWITRINRTGATGPLAVTFQAKNLVRDTMDRAVFSNSSVRNIMSTNLSALSEILGEGNLWKEYVRSGAALSGRIAQDDKMYTQLIKEFNGNPFHKAFGGTREAMQRLLRISENTNRVGEFISVLSDELAARTGTVGKMVDTVTGGRKVVDVVRKGVPDGMVKVKISGGKELMVTEEAFNEAAAKAGYGARSLMDFGRGGTYGREANKYISFFNAGLQDLNRTGSAMKNRPLQYTTRGAMTLTLPTIGLWLINRNNQNYKEMSAARKAISFNIPLAINGYSVENTPYFLPVPKPLGINTFLFSNTTEDFLNYAHGTKGDEIAKNLVSQLGMAAPTYLPNILYPVFLYGAGKDLFSGRDVEKPHEKLTLPPVERFDDRTSLTAVEASRLLDNLGVGVSPKMLEATATTFGANVSKEVLSVADAAGVKLREQGVLPSKTFRSGKETLADTPIEESFMYKGTGINRDLANEYYDLSGKVKQASGAIDKYEPKKDSTEAPDFYGQMRVKKYERSASFDAKLPQWDKELKELRLKIESTRRTMNPSATRDRKIIQYGRQMTQIYKQAVSEMKRVVK